jgi:hypothetical protein
LSVLSKRVAALEASLPPPPSQFAIKDYCRGDDGFDAALAEMVEKDRGKPGGITDQHEVFSISVIKHVNCDGFPGRHGRSVKQPASIVEDARQAFRQESIEEVLVLMTSDAEEIAAQICARPQRGRRTRSPLAAARWRRNSSTNSKRQSGIWSQSRPARGRRRSMPGRARLLS